MTSDLIEHNPMLKKPLCVVLAIAAQHTSEDRRALEASATETWDDTYTQSPAVSVDILVRNGALTEELFVNDEPYEGTLVDLQADETVFEDAVVESRISITNIGRALLAEYAPAKTLRTLLANKPEYRDVFATVLAACNTTQGATRAQLERTISALPQLQPNPDTQRTRVYPQYFIDALETAGGITWNGSWHTTDTGKTIIAA